MKKTLTILICLLLSTVAFSQDNKGFFGRIKDAFTSHDTVYIYINANDTLMVNDEEGEGDEDNGFSGGIPFPIDTLNTADRYCKVVLFDNGTWLYYNLEKPDVPDSLSTDHWDTQTVHSYRDVSLKDLPDTVTLTLVDSVHRFCIPYSGYVTSRFKFRWGRPHRGIDISLHTGDVVYAAFDGIVRVALPTSMTGGYGNCLVIRHNNGLETYYGHLSSYIVKSGDLVRAGEPIGYGGSTGYSTGPHLHFETRYMGQSFDPERIFDFENGTLRTEELVLYKHYFHINSHYGMTDEQSLAASKVAPKESGSKAKKGGGTYYTVKKGDTLGKIAKRHGTTVKKLCQLNGIKQNKPLRIGQRLRVR